MDGLLLVDKPAGITSHDVVDAIRNIAHTRRVGHAGTLDPFATGLLILGINKGTKALTGLVGLDKTYEATAKLGAISTTDDPEGIIAEGSACPHPDTDVIQTVLSSFLGAYEQTAPVFSAKKVGGKKLYELARKGKMEGIVLPKKIVTIHDIALLDYRWPNLHFRVSCSSGTYIRALAKDIGAKLGCGAYLTELRRTNIGDHRIEDAIALIDINEKNIGSRLIPMI